MALLLLYLGATPEVSPITIVVTYFAVFLYSAVFTCWPRQVEGYLRRFPALMVIDALFGASLIFAYGWGSPFYVYSFSPVMLAGYLFGLRGAFLLAGVGGLGYMAGVSVNGRVWADIVALGEIDTHIFQIFDYFLIAIFFSYPAALADRLRSANEELRRTQSKIARIVLAQERQRIAADIHDNVTQSLLGIKLLLEASAKRNTDDPMLDRQLALAQEAARNAMREMREAVDDLFFERLDSLEISEIAQEALELMSERHGLVTRLHASGQEPKLSVGTKKAAYLIIQESLSNVAKHAQAHAISVEIKFTAGELFLSITDDGKGFDSEGELSGHGLNSMERRVAELGGTYAASSAPGSGTTIDIRLPQKQTARKPLQIA